MATWEEFYAAPVTQCWCGAPVVHVDWCRSHAPRCRSGAHFHGNCQCIGEDHLRAFKAQNLAAAYHPHNQPRAAGEE